MAMPRASAASSGLKRTWLASATWNTPSLKDDVTRLTKSRRNPRPRSRVNRARRKVTLHSVRSGAPRTVAKRAQRAGGPIRTAAHTHATRRRASARRRRGGSRRRRTAAGCRAQRSRLPVEDGLPPRACVGGARVGGSRLRGGLRAGRLGDAGGDASDGRQGSRQARPLVVGKLPQDGGGGLGASVPPLLESLTGR